MKILLIVFLLLSVCAFAQEQGEYDPCTDPLLTRLSEKDSLSNDEAKIYIELRKMCDRKVEQDLERKKVDAIQQNADSVEEMAGTQTAWLWIAGIIIGLSILFGI